jgi:hypothetical protein
MAEPMIAVVMNPSSLRPTVACNIDACSFENVAYGIVFGPNAEFNTAENLEFFLFGLGALVDGQHVFGSTAQLVYVDNSGNTTNNASWLTSTNTRSVAFTKRSNSQH